MTRNFLGVLAVVLAGAGAGGGIYAAITSGSRSTVVRQVTVAGAQPAAARPLSVTAVYQAARRGVVEITATSVTGLTPFGGSDAQQAQGSGFVYDSSGHVVTNEHVVDGARSVGVRLWDGSSHKASVVATDPSTDLAVLKVDAPPSAVRPLALGDSSALQVGQPVVAIGSPFGLDETVTAGIVSALHRQMTAPNAFTIADSIQTDAAINHGNSGGPLLDLNAQVVGVTAQIESDSGGSDGVGFAIPSNTVRSVVSQLIASGSAEHAYLGVEITGAGSGAQVTAVRSGTPAARAGLRAGDVVTALDGRAIGSSADLASAIDGKRPGDTVTLTLRRSGRTTTVKVTLGRRPS